MSKDEWKVWIAIFICVVLMTTEFVACEWHADVLTHGCKTNDCAALKH